MTTTFSIIAQSLLAGFRSLIPIILVVSFFQLLVLQQPFPDLLQLLLGLLLVVVGLTLFVAGLEIGLFPLGESMAYAFARKGNVWWLLAFTFALGFGATMAEPALVAIADKAAEVAAGYAVIPDTGPARRHYALELRFTVSLAVGLALMLGVLRIIRGWPVHYLVIGGYLGVSVLSLVAPAEFIAIAYDAGPVAVSSITVPLVVALGIGLASSIKGRNPVSDGFGLVVFAAVLPMIFVMIYGVLK